MRLSTNVVCCLAADDDSAAFDDKHCSVDDAVFPDVSCSDEGCVASFDGEICSGDVEIPNVHSLFYLFDFILFNRVLAFFFLLVGVGIPVNVVTCECKINQNKI